MPARKPNVPKGQASKSLSIAKPDKQVLSKAQQTFNRLVKKIEKLQKEIEASGQMLDEQLKIFAEKIYPLEQKDLQLRKQILLGLYPYYSGAKKLPKASRKPLKELLVPLLNFVLSQDPEEPDPEVIRIFEDLEGMTMEEAEKEEAERMKTQMSSMFSSMGFDMDFSELDLNADPEALNRKLEEMDDGFYQQMDEKQQDARPRKKTKKQLEKEEREKQAEALKSKNIIAIYKQLAKMLHPDLETDAGEKTRKEALMKELTAAYKKNDLHTLLKLELQFIQAEENNIEKLTDEKLSIYNQVLKEQAAELEQEVFMVEEHPRFQVLRRFAFMPGTMRYINLKLVEKEMKSNISSMGKTSAALQTEDALQEVKRLVNLIRQR